MDTKGNENAQSTALGEDNELQQSPPALASPPTPASMGAADEDIHDGMCACHLAGLVRITSMANRADPVLAESIEKRMVKTPVDAQAFHSPQNAQKAVGTLAVDVMRAHRRYRLELVAASQMEESDERFRELVAFVNKRMKLDAPTNDEVAGDKAVEKDAGEGHGPDHASSSN